MASARWNRTAAWAFFALAALSLVAQAGSLYVRGSKVESDFGVFYRTCRLLDEGVGGELYEARDSVTGWPISIPPAGLAILQPLSRMEPPFAAAAWAVINLAFAALGVWGLRRLLMHTGIAEVFPWLAGVFMALAGGSVQVGQFSLFFAVCWIIAAIGLSSGRQDASMVALTWPSAIKAYPLLMFAVPALSFRSWTAVLRGAAVSLVALLALAWALPSLFYGGRTAELNASFVSNVLVDQGGRIKWMQALGSTANQGLDAVMIRYLGWYPKFHEQYSNVPTLGLEVNVVRRLGHIVRLVLIAVTLFVVVRWRRGAKGTPWEVLQLAAVWSSTLYLVLPETRARYAVMAFLGFVSLWTWAGKSPVRLLVFAVTLLLVMGAMPKQWEVFGVGLLGSLALWLASLHELRRVV